MAIKIPELEIDGVIGEVYDNDALHSEDIYDFLQIAGVKAALLDMFFPIGKLWISDDPTNPSEIIGGTWEPIQERFILAVGSHYPVGSEDGSADAIVPEHTHLTNASISEAGSHTHNISGTAASAGSHRHGVYYVNFEETGSGTQHKAVGSSGNYVWSSTEGAHTHNVAGSAAAAGGHTHSVTVTVNSSGVDAIGKNMPPYHASYVWKRTA